MNSRQEVIQNKSLVITHIKARSRTFKSQLLTCEYAYWPMRSPCVHDAGFVASSWAWLSGAVLYLQVLLMEGGVIVCLLHPGVVQAVLY